MNTFDKLELSTETIRDLTTVEMQQVAGGGTKPTLVCLTGTETYTCPTFNGCLTGNYTG
jgi:hypothetical protein